MPRPGYVCEDGQALECEGPVRAGLLLRDRGLPVWGALALDEELDYGEENCTPKHKIYFTRIMKTGQLN